MTRTLWFIVIVALAQCLLLAGVSADRRIETLRKKASANNNVIKLDSESFDKYTRGKRDYGIAVVLTATGAQFRCKPCSDFEPEFRLVASSAKKAQGDYELFFGYLDIQHGQEIFQRYALQTAPNVFYFAPSEDGKSEPSRYDLMRSGLTAESFARFMSQHAGQDITIQRPFDYARFGLKIAGVFIAAILIKLMYPRIRFLFFHKYTWAAICIFGVITMISGHMWNRIRKPPSVMQGQGGSVSFIANGFTQQLGLESQIVAGIYFALSFSIVSLIVSVPSFDDKLRQRLGGYIWMGCIIIIFGGLVSLFRIKNGGYPFKFIF